MCDHVWRKVNEQFIMMGEYFPIGWKCELCDKFLSLQEMKPGIVGEVSPREELIGAHGGYIVTASGKKCRRQIYDKDTEELTYEE